MSERTRTTILIYVGLLVGLLFGLLLCSSPAHAHGASNWGPDDFGDGDGIIEVHRENVGFKGILKEEIRQYNRMRGNFFVDEDIIRQVPTPEKAEVIIRANPTPDFACGEDVNVYVGFDVKDIIRVSDGCFDHITHFNDYQPLRGAILHGVIGHLNGIHHHEDCTPILQRQTVMVSGINNSGCGVTLQSLGSHDIATLAAPDDGVTTESVPLVTEPSAYPTTTTKFGRHNAYSRFKTH